jgi:hypothetical protein
MTGFSRTLSTKDLKLLCLNALAVPTLFYTTSVVLKITGFAGVVGKKCQY